MSRPAPLPGFRIRLAVIAAASLALGGCGVAAVPHVATTQKVAALPAQVRIEAVGPASAARTRLVEALKSALAARGITDAPGSATAVTLAVAQRPASMGVTQDNGASPADIRWLSSPRKPMLFDGCKAQRLEAVVTVKPDTAPALAYAGRGGFDFCTLDPASLDDLAARFAAEMTAG